MPVDFFGERFVTATPIFMMVFYFAGIAFTIANYSGYFRFHSDVYGQDFLNAYLAFTVLGAVAYFIWCGPFWLWAAKYSEKPSQSTRRLCYGMGGILLFHDLPIFIMEYHAILCCGWLNGYQGFVFIFQHIEFLVSFSFGWLSYAYVMAGFLQGQVNYTNGEAPGLKTGAVQVHILPGLGNEEMLQTPLTGPQPVPFPNAAPANVFSPRDRMDPSWSGGRQFAQAPPLPVSDRYMREPSQGQMSSSQRPIPLRENLGESASDDEGDHAAGLHFASRVVAPSYSPRESVREHRGSMARGPVVVIPQHGSPVYTSTPMNSQHDGAWGAQYTQSNGPRSASRPLGSVFVERTAI